MPFINSAYKPVINQPNNKIIWLDYLISSNPQGVMRVLANYGYTGYLAPQDHAELKEATYDFIENYGDKAVIELLKSNPLYDIIAGISKDESTITIPFKNASGIPGEIITTIQSFDVKKAIELLLMLIGSFAIAEMIWKKFVKE